MVYYVENCTSRVNLVNQTLQTGEGMANWSEQTGESGHHKVKIELSRFQMAEENPLHGERMLSGCGRFNSKQI